MICLHKLSGSLQPIVINLTARRVIAADCQYLIHLPGDNISPLAVQVQLVVTGVLGVTVTVVVVSSEVVGAVVV